MALSGGADSAVAAGLLQKAGFQVEGAFLKLADNENTEKGELAAKKVAQKLKFSLRVFDFRSHFLNLVIRPSLKIYKEGLTPNPCIFCNDRLKFGLFLQKAQEIDFSWVASGHYLRKSQDQSGFHLWRAKDGKKDQSYFLWPLDQDRLAHLLFPLGDYLYSEVKNLVKTWGLEKFIRPTSQDLCFVKTEMKNFLQEKLGEKPGRILDLKGKFLGEHSGLWFHTLGQRKDLDLARGPFYVVGKDIKQNHLLVSSEKEDLMKNKFFIKEVNWIQREKPSFPFKGKIKIRSQSQPLPGEITPESSSLFSCRSSQEAVTPGQSAVFYQGEEMVGGGIIAN